MVRLLTTFVGLSSGPGTITGVAKLKAGDRIIGVSCTDEIDRTNSYFTALIEADGEVQQVINTDLSGITITVLAERAVLI